MAADQNNNDTPVQDASAAQDTSAETSLNDTSSRSRGFDYEGFPRPGDNDHLPMHPGIDMNPNENLERMFKLNFDDMMKLFEQEKPEAAEEIAQELLQWANLPCLYRIYAHMVLSWGPGDNLWYAEKAVEEAQSGLERYGDNEFSRQLFSGAQQSLEDVRAYFDSSETADTEEAENIEDELIGVEDDVEVEKEEELNMET